MHLSKYILEAIDNRNKRSNTQYHIETYLSSLKCGSKNCEISKD